MMLLSFFSGAVAMGFAVAACFFLRFWAKTRDGLFLAFAAAFLLMALNELLLSLLANSSDESSLAFVPRLLAFVLIIAAILWKNVAAGRRS